VAAGSVLVSGGVGVAPGYSASPSLTSLTLSSGLTVSGGGAGITGAVTITQAGTALNLTSSTSNVEMHYNTSGGSGNWALGPGAGGGTNFNLYSYAAGSTLLSLTNGGALSVSGNGTFNGVNIGNGATGFYGDSTNVAARIPAAAGGFYVQNNGASTTYAIIGPASGYSSAQFYGDVAVTGALNLSCTTVELTATANAGSTIDIRAYSGAGTNFATGVYCGAGYSVLTSSCVAYGGTPGVYTIQDGIYSGEAICTWYNSTGAAASVVVHAQCCKGTFY
jgi:hypothetical protein